MRQCGRAQPEAGQPGGLPVLQQVGQPGGRAGEDAGVAAVLGPGPLVQALLARDGGGLGLVEEHHQVTEDVHGLRGPAGAGLLGPDLVTISAAWAASRGVTNPTSAERAISWYGTLAWPRAATIGWPCGGRGVIDGPFTENQRPSKSM